MTYKSNQHFDLGAYDHIRKVYRPKPRSRWQKFMLTVLMILLLLFFVGPFLELTIGETFIFAYADEYRSAMPRLFAALFPVFAIVFYFVFKNDLHFRSRYPTWFVRWLIMFPVFVSMATGMVIIAPLGWIALHGKWTGDPISGVSAEVIEVGERYKGSRNSCALAGQLRIHQATAKICLEKVLRGTALPGSHVTIIGKQSAFGIYIEEMRLVP